MYVSYVGSLVRSVGNVPKDPGSNPLTSINHCFTFCNWQYDALEGNRSQFFLQHKTRHPFRCRGTACTVDIYQRALWNHPSPRSTFREEYLFRRYLPTRPAEPPPPSFHIVKSTCSVDIYQLVLRNLRPPLSTSALRKLPPFLPAAR